MMEHILCTRSAVAEMFINLWKIDTTIPEDLIECCPQKLNLKKIIDFIKELDMEREL